MEDKMTVKNVAKKLLAKFRPYFNEETGKLNDDAPKSAVKAFEQFNELVDAMKETKDYKKTPPYFATKEDAEEWSKKNKE